MTALVYAGRLVTVVCWCGIHHAIPAELDRQAEDKGRSVYCPLGHTWVYTETTEQKLARAEQRLADERRRHQASRDLLAHEERSHAATRGHLTRTKKRVAHGVCPCCNRTFQNLRRHMATKHPTYESDPK